MELLQNIASVFSMYNDFPTCFCVPACSNCRKVGTVPDENYLHAIGSMSKRSLINQKILHSLTSTFKCLTLLSIYIKVF